MAREIDNNKDLYKRLQEESESTIKELERQTDENAKLESNLSAMRKKNKEFNAVIKELEEKVERIKQKEHEEYELSLNKLKRQLEEQ